jgi:anti-sigma regulatory factor (Ser/Thr protein kinase)
VNIDRAFPNTSQSITRARRYALDNLDDLAPELADRVSLLVSELATNAVRHAASSFTVSIERDASSIRVAVTDAGDGKPLVQSPAPTDYSGRGLLIVRTLADTWGVTEASDGSGKSVWFTLVLGARAADIGDELGRDTSERGQASRKRSRGGRARRATRVDGTDPRLIERETKRTRPPTSSRNSCRPRRRGTRT